MDWNSLLTTLQNKISPKTIQVGDTSYGPAYSPYSHTPIVYSTNIPHQGQFDPATGVISIDPTRDDQSMNSVMRHESMHSILNMLGTDANKVVTASPAYPDVAAKLGGLGGGVPEHEAPAVAASGEIYGVDDAKRRQMQNDNVLSIKALGRPDIAAMYQKDIGK